MIQCVLIQEMVLEAELLSRRDHNAKDQERVHQKDTTCQIESKKDAIGKTEMVWTCTEERQ